MLRSQFYVSSHLNVPRRVVHDAFTSGDCWVLANCLRELRGWSFVYAVKPADPSMWHHVAVYTSKKMVLDVEGISGVGEWISKWDGVLRISPIADFSCLRRKFPRVDAQSTALALLKEFQL